MDRDEIEVEYAERLIAHAYKRITARWIYGYVGRESERGREGRYEEREKEEGLERKCDSFPNVLPLYIIDEICCRFPISIFPLFYIILAPFIAMSSFKLFSSICFMTTLVFYTLDIYIELYRIFHYIIL